MRFVSFFPSVEVVSDVGTLKIRLGHAGNPFDESFRLEQLFESETKLAAHEAVKNKINSAVDESQNIHDFSEEIVAVSEEARSQNPTQKAEDT